MENIKIPKRIRSEEYHRKCREMHKFRMETDEAYRNKQLEYAERYRRKKGIAKAIRYSSKEEKRIAKNKRNSERYANDLEYRIRCLSFGENIRRKNGIKDYHSKRNVSFKICTKCKEEKSIGNFRIKNNGGIFPQCKECELKYHNEYNKLNMPDLLIKQKKRVGDLTDGYVKRKIVRENRFGISVTKEMIDVKRLEIQIKRLCAK